MPLELPEKDRNPNMSEVTVQAIACCIELDSSCCGITFCSTTNSVDSKTYNKWNKHLH